MQTLDELFREDEAKRLAEANTPERIAADAALWERNRAKMARELEVLESQGMIDHGGEDDDEEEEEE